LAVAGAAGLAVAGGAGFAGACAVPEMVDRVKNSNAKRTLTTRMTCPLGDGAHRLKRARFNAAPIIAAIAKLSTSPRVVN
jgi:hypothetical protein